MRATISAVLTAGLLACVDAAGADWHSVRYELREGEANTVRGPDKAYTSVRPADGAWSERYELRNHFANLGGHDIRGHSASVVTFRDYVVASGHSGMSSRIVFRIRLSEPVSEATWDIGAHGRHVSPGALLEARYSADGANWSAAHVYPAGQGEYRPPRLRLAFARPTKDLYIGLFAEVDEGQTAYWNLGSTGTLTFAPTAAPPSLADTTGDPQDPTAPSIELHGQRFVPNTFFGTTTHVNSERGIELLMDLNVHTVRIDFRWFGLEPARGSYAFSSDMWMITSADLGLAHGLDQLPVITMAPKWALGENGTFPNDRSVDALEEFMYRIATKYKGRIKYWQAMNEPNMAVWKDRFVTFLRAFHHGVKRADPENRVVLCGFAGQGPSQLEALYRYGGREYFDVLASHSYTRPQLPEEGGYVDKIQALHEVMGRHGDHKPLWVTEMGWNGVEPSMLEHLRAKYAGHRSYACTEEDQARGLARLYLISATMPWIERVYFFHLQQEAPYTKVMEQADYYMGLVTPWGEGQTRPKDAYFAVKTVVRMIGESTYRKRIELGSRLWALVFEREEDAVVALWSLDDHVTMVLPDASAIKDVTSMVGTPVLVRDGQLQLSGRPVYLTTLPRNLTRLTQGLQQALVRGSRAFQLAVGLDLQRTTSRQPVLAVTVANTGRDARIPPPIFLQAGPAEWKLGRDRIVDDVPLPTGGERTHTVLLHGPPGQRGETTVDAMARLLDGDSDSRAARTLRYLVARAAPEAFVAEGDLGEWAGVTPVVIGESPAQREFVEWGGAEDCAARWYCAHNRRGLVFAAEVADDRHHQPIDEGTADTMWRSDGIQIAFDVAGDARPVSNVPQYDGVDDVEIGLALSPRGPLAYAWVNPRGTTGVLTLDEYRIVRDEQAKATRYEVVIPWSVLGLARPPVGQWLGMNVLVNDDDGDGRRGWLEWAPGIGHGKDPSQFPKVLMQAEADSGDPD